MQEEITMLGISGNRALQLGEMLDSEIKSIRTLKDVSDFLTQMDMYIRENITKSNEQALCYIVLGMTLNDALTR